MSATLWASVADITAATGVTVNASTRSIAANAIELTTGLIEAVERTDVSDRDRYWLKLAVCYQAAWIVAQPDYLERNAIASASQDGQAATGGNPDWLVLAPLARKALKRLSWRGVRTVSTQPGRRAVVNVNDDDYEDTLDWSPV